MKREIGIWIDNSKSIIVTLSGGKQEVRKVKSNIGKHVQFEGVPDKDPIFGTYSISKEGKDDPNFTNWLSSYYDNVASLIRNADAIWIMGPGEAKIEVEKRLRREQFEAQIIGIETVDQMTDHQIVAKVRLHYQN